MPVFGVSKNDKGKFLLPYNSIINYGVELNNFILFETKQGNEKKLLSDFKSPLKVFNINELCLNTLMHKWRLFNDNYNPVYIDYSIESEEVYKNKFSPLEIMVKREKNKTLIKPLIY